MLERGKNERGVIEIVDTESLVPREHLLRQVEEALDFKKLYEIVEPLYSEDEGRRSVDPVVLFKIVLLQHLDRNTSLRGTLRRAQEVHTACDKNGYVLEAVVTPGNVHDSVAFDDVYDKLIQSFPEVETVVADAAYKTPHICKKVFRDGRVLSTAYKRPMTMKGGHPWWTYVYDEYYDCVICPEYQILSYRTTNRDGYREYRSDPKICAQCPTRHLCTRSKNCVKTVQRHIWKDYEVLADDARYTPEYKDLYAKRKETIERVFADAKEKHAMRYTHYRGLAQVSNWVRLKFAAMNLKKLARWKTRRHSPLLLSNFFKYIFLQILRPAWFLPDQAAFRQADRSEITAAQRVYVTIHKS